MAVLGVNITEISTNKVLPCYSTEMVACMDSVLLDYQAYANGWEGYTQSMSTINISTIKEDYIVLTKDYVIVTWVGKVEMLMKSGDKITYKPIRYTDVYKKVDSQWKVIFEQSSGIPVVQAAEKK